MKQYEITYRYNYKNESYTDKITIFGSSILNARKIAVERAKMRNLPSNVEMQIRKINLPKLKK